MIADHRLFNFDTPVMWIRPSTAGEAARRAERWARSRTRKLRRRLELTARAQRSGPSPGNAPEAEPLVPWRELAAGWQQICASHGVLFVTEEEEEQARVAYHEGGPRWRLFFAALNERKRDQGILAPSRR